MPVEELKTAVKNAKGKRSYFAFIQKSATDGTLLVDKSKIRDTDITTAKKKNGGSTTLKGACFGEGQFLVFEMAKDPDDKEKLEDALKKVIKRDADLMVVPLCRRGNAPDLFDAPPSGVGAGYGVPIPAPNQEPPQSGAKPQPGNGYGVPIPVKQEQKPGSGYGVPIPAPNQAPSKSNLGDAYYEKRKPIEMRLKEGLKQGRADSPKLKEIFSYSESSANKQQFDRGIQGLNALDKMLSKPSAKAAPQIGDIRRQYLARRRPIEPRLTTALKAHMPNNERLATTFKIAEHRANKEEFAGAIQALDVVEQLLRAAPAEPEHGGEAPLGYAGVREGMPAENRAEPEQGEPPLDYGGLPEPLNAPQANGPMYANRGESASEPPGEVDEQEGPPPLDYVGVGDPSIGPQGNPELDALLDASMDSDQLDAERALLVNQINSDWAESIDLTNATVDFPRDAAQGSFGKLGFIDTGDPSCPRLAIKVPLNQDVATELQHEVDQYKKAGEHPNIAKCMGIVQVGGHRGLVMEAIDGDNMKNTMSSLQDAYKDGKVSHEEYWGIQQYMMRETLKGLAQLEQQGLVHNDIRPDNLMIDKNTGDVKIIDFGVAVGSGETVRKFPLQSGTASPDLAETPDRRLGGPVTPKHDDFAVGAMTYHAGEKQPFDYNQPGKAPSIPRLNAFAAFAPPEQVALRPGDETNPAFTKDSQGSAMKEPGRYGAETAYTKFVNKLMDPDPTNRLSASDALKEDFLTDSPIDDDAARKLLAKLLSSGGQQSSAPQQNAEQPEFDGNADPRQPGAPLNYGNNPEENEQPPQSERPLNYAERTDQEEASTEPRGELNYGNAQ